MKIPEEKKAHILRLIPLGVDIFTACVQAHLSLDEIESLEEDEAFSREVEYAQHAEEIRLLTLYGETVDRAASLKLDHKGVRDRLALLNPERYGKQTDKNPKKDEKDLVEVYFKIPNNGREQ